MELPDDASKSPKLLFLLGDAAFLGVATFLALTAGDQPSTSSIVGIIVCTGIGVALGIAPFLLDYARSRDQQLTERQNALEALARTTSTASDQASIAANGLHEIAEITKRNLHAIEQLPQQIQQAKTVALSASEENHTAAVNALQKDLSELRASHEAHIKTLLPEFKKVLKAVAALKTELSTAIAPPPAPVIIAPPRPKSAVESSKLSKVPAPAPTSAEAPPAAPKKKKTPKAKPQQAPPPPTEPSLFEHAPEDKPAVPESAQKSGPKLATKSAPAEESPSPESTEPTSESPEPAPETQVEATSASIEAKSTGQPIDDAPPTEPAVPADGTTRLTVTAYIGIGNRLFIRGNGPGLNPDEGTPLQFVSIGKWRWESDVATVPFHVTLWKNDEEECTAAGQIEITPGAQVETSANF